MLRFTDVELKLISNIEKYKLIEGVTDGVILMICESYSKANNKFLKS